MTHANPAIKDDYLFKLIMLGDSGVGKTQLVNRFTKKLFDVNIAATIGLEFISQTVTIDEKQITAQIWDTTGDETYDSLTKIYFRGAVGAILVYDITKKGTFDCIQNRWMDAIREFSSQNIIMVLIGNKCDLKDQREVRIKDATAFAEEQGKFK